MHESPNVSYRCQLKRSVHRHSSRPSLVYPVRTKSPKNADITLLTHSVGAQLAYRSGHHKDRSVVVFLRPLLFWHQQNALQFTLLFFPS
jgi:hypothetical protein